MRKFDSVYLFMYKIQITDLSAFYGLTKLMSV